MQEIKNAVATISCNNGLNSIENAVSNNKNNAGNFHLLTLNKK